jgi:tetratricopeptide (TPR) repeat protein
MTNPTDPLQSAIAHHRAGRLAEAEAGYRAAVARNANDPRALHMLGAVLVQQRRPADAIPHLQRAAKIAPQVAEIHFALGEAFRLTGAFAAAEAAYRQTLSIRALFPQAHNALGLALVQQGKIDSAIVSWQRAIQLKPDFPEPHANLGAALAQQEKFSEAATVLRKAVQLNPKFAPAHNNLANVLSELEETDEAIAHWEAAILLAPNYHDALNNLGRALQLRGEHARSQAMLERAVAAKPDDPDSRFLRGLGLLAGGDFQRGFADYHFRLACKDFQLHGRTFAQPAWNGEDVAGKTFLIHTEQGLGDTIQFVRYAPMLAARGARVIVECPPDLADLLRTVKGVAEVIARPKPLPPFDVHAAVLDLPRLFGTTLETVPADVPYVAADPTRADKWREELSSDVIPRGPRVGLVWSGNPKHANDRNRSIPLREFEPLAALTNINFFNLQKGPAAGQMSDSTLTLKLIDHTAKLHDFADTAALISQLDLVIAVDTSVAHLAAALGKPVWVLLPKVADWRWMLERPDSPWYPTMRLVRQSTAGEWADVVGEVTAELKKKF